MLHVCIYWLILAYLALTLVLISQDNCVVPDLRSKIVTWLKKHAYIGSIKKNLKVKIKSSLASKDGMGAAEGADAVLVSESDIPDVVPVKSVPPRRRTKSNIRILKEHKGICSSKEMISDDEIVVDEAKRGHLISEDASYSTKQSEVDITNKVSHYTLYQLFSCFLVLGYKTGTETTENVLDNSVWLCAVN